MVENCFAENREQQKLVQWKRLRLIQVQEILNKPTMRQELTQNAAHSKMKLTSHVALRGENKRPPDPSM